MKRKYFLFALMLLNFFNEAIADIKNSKILKWEGEWKGQCIIMPPLNGISEFGMNLSVSPVSGTDRYSWKITYIRSKSTAPDVRAYELVPIDPENGQYAIDEKTGIILDAFFNGNVLYSTFTISSKLLNTRYELTDSHSMVIEMSVFSATPIRRSQTPDSSFIVNSFGLLSVQHCSLKKESLSL